MRPASNGIVTSLDLASSLIQVTPSAAWRRCSGQRQLERQGRDRAALGGAPLHVIKGDEAGDQLADFGRGLLHGRKVAAQLLRNSGSRRFDNLCALR